MKAGIRELRDNLSRYIRTAERGEPVLITAHGRVVAELVRPSADVLRAGSEMERLLAASVIAPPEEDGDPLENRPDIRLERGFAATLIDSERGET